MEMSWAVNEFGQADLGDARRTKRLIWLAEQRAQQPSASIPQSCGGWTGSMAAYRFFSNPHISAESILGSHVQASLVRLQAERVVLAVQDTTELDFTSHPATLDLGYLADEQHQGLLVHSTLLVTPQRVGMGVLQQQVWTRSPEEFGQRGTRKDRAVAEKESQKWMASLEAAAQLQSQLPDTRVVSVGDREADVYDLFVRAQAPHQDLLVRAAQNRRVSEEQGYLWPQVESQPVAGQAVVSVQRQAERPARQATVEVRFCLVTLQPPRYRAGEGLPEVPVWAVGVEKWTRRPMRSRLTGCC